MLQLASDQICLTMRCIKLVRASLLLLSLIWVAGTRKVSFIVSLSDLLLENHLLLTRSNRLRLAIVVQFLNFCASGALTLFLNLIVMILNT